MPNTISKELAERLHELGVKKESYFAWVTVNGKINVMHDDGRWKIHHGPAYTSDELLDMLPATLEDDEGMKFDLNMWKSGISTLYVAYWWDEDTRHSSDTKITTLSGQNFAEVLGEMLAYLLTHGLLSPEKLN